MHLWASIWVLGIQPGSRARATSALSFWATSPSHWVPFLVNLHVKIQNSHLGTYWQMVPGTSVDPHQPGQPQCPLMYPWLLWAGWHQLQHESPRCELEGPLPFARRPHSSIREQAGTLVSPSVLWGLSFISQSWSIRECSWWTAEMTSECSWNIFNCLLTFWLL